MKKKLNQLRERLTKAANRTKDPETARELFLIVDQVVTQLERLENQDEKTQNEERSIIDWEVRHSPRAEG